MSLGWCDSGDPSFLPLPALCGERVGVRGSLDSGTRGESPLTRLLPTVPRIARRNPTSPRKRGEVQPNPSCSNDPPRPTRQRNIPCGGQLGAGAARAGVVVVGPRIVMGATHMSILLALV